MNNIINYQPKSKYTIITEYEPKFCDLYIEYAKEFLNPDGFWGKYNIDESMKEIWIKKYPEFKQTVALIPNISTDVLNKGMKQILDSAVQIGDIKTVTQIMLKIIDFQFRTNKEGGEIKDKAKTNKLAKDTSDLDVSSLDEQTVRDFLNKQLYV